MKTMNSPSSIHPTTLQGRHVRLEPLTIDHLDALCVAGLDEELWRWTPRRITSRDEMRTFVEDALEGQQRGEMLPFATIERSSGRVVGSTRFGAIDLANRRVEIGWTWVAVPWQRTAINTEAKLLMLAHAFDTWGCHRVEFKTDALNVRSRQAIIRLGAMEEGTLRKHIVTGSGRIRDTVYFSIIDDEWPGVRDRLSSRVA